MPPMRTVFPPMTVSTAASFFTVSVVMMAWAAASLAASECSRAAYSAGTPSSMTCTFSVWPMTPVEDTSTSSCLHPMALAAAAHMDGCGFYHVFRKNGSSGAVRIGNDADHILFPCGVGLDPHMNACGLEALGGAHAAVNKIQHSRSSFLGT